MWEIIKVYWIRTIYIESKNKYVLKLFFIKYKYNKIRRTNWTVAWQTDSRRFSDQNKLNIIMIFVQRKHHQHLRNDSTKTVFYICNIANDFHLSQMFKWKNTNSFVLVQNQQKKRKKKNTHTHKKQRNISTSCDSRNLF